MASKKLPKKINVSILDEKSSKEAKKKSFKEGKLTKAAKEALKEVKTDDRFQKTVNRYNYKKGSPKNKTFMNHEVPQGQEKKAFWLWISVGITLFFIFFLWVGTLMYLDFFKIEQAGQEETSLGIITDDIKSSYSDFTDSLGDIGEQLGSIKEEINNIEEVEEIEEVDEPLEEVPITPGLEVESN